MWTIGVDLGGTNLRVGLFQQGELCHEKQIPTHAERGPDTVIRRMIEVINEVKGSHDISGIGIGSPGPLDPFKGIILSPPNLVGFRNVPLAKKIQNIFQAPVIVNNDANVAALAEARLGAGQGHQSVFYITVSTGIGGGYVLNGEIVQGAQGQCAEIENMIIDPNAKEEFNGLNQGSLEALASGTAIAIAATERYGYEMDAEEVFGRYKKGDLTAQEIIHRAVNYLAIGIANLVHTVNPEIFVLGGGVMKSEDVILPLIKEKVRGYVFPILRDELRIEPAMLGQKAGLIGAGLLVQTDG